MSIVKIANECAERLVKDIPAPKPVYRIVWGVTVRRLRETIPQMICWDDFSREYPCPVAYLVRVK